MSDISKVAALQWMLLGDPDVKDSSVANSNHVECDVDARGVLYLWAAVCEEFGERSVGSEIELGTFTPAMTVTTTAATMANQLAQCDDGH